MGSNGVIVLVCFWTRACDRLALHRIALCIGSCLCIRVVDERREFSCRGASARQCASSGDAVYGITSPNTSPHKYLALVQKCVKPVTLLCRFPFNNFFVVRLPINFFVLQQSSSVQLIETI